MSASTVDTNPKAERLVSLDAYRGFTMTALAFGGGGFVAVAEKFPDSKFGQFVQYQFDHVAWTGCAVWDLIQPSFMFIVGVAMPYSYASRKARGDSEGSMFAHVAWRALMLMLLGVFLRSNGRSQTYWTFEDVISQIGLGYIFIYLIMRKGVRAQAIGTAAILIGYWLLFALWPQPGADFDATQAGIPPDWNQFAGFAAHWNKHLNPAGYFDQWFLNLFPREKPFVVNGGGYQTLSFIPSMATTLFGVMTGELLRGTLPLAVKCKRIALGGLACLAFGMIVDGHIWPIVDFQWSIAPIVKRIWSPSWAVFSTGWALLALSFFVYAIDIKGWKKIAFPCIVVGMNSIAMYVMEGLIMGWIRQTLHTHFGDTFFSGLFGPLIMSAMTLAVMWSIVYWMYRKKIFLRI